MANDSNVDSLVSLIGPGLRTVVIIQIASLIDFAFFRSLEDFSPIGSIYDGMNITCQLILILLNVIITGSADIAPAGLQLVIFFGLCALLLSIFENLRIFSEKPFLWTEALFAVYFLLLNVTVLAIAIAARYGFNWTTWIQAVEKHSHIGSLYGTAYQDVKKSIEGRVLLFFVVEALIPFEVVTLFIYFVCIGSLGARNYNFTGWIYLVHGVAVIVAMIWYFNTLSYHRRTPDEKKFYLGANSPPSTQFIGSIYTLTFVLEVCQLIYAQGFDHTQLIVLRAFLCVISGIYLVVSVFIGLQYDAPPRPVMLFYTLQFFLGIIVTFDASWLITYFCYASALGINPPVFANLAHVLTVATGLGAIFAAAKPLDAVAIMAVVASVVVCVDIIFTGRSLILEKESSQIFVQFVFLGLSLCYLLLAGISYSGSSDVDAIKYMKLVESERLTGKNLIQTFRDSYVQLKTEVTQEKVNHMAEAVAKRMYFIITGPIKTVAVMEFVFVVYYLTILIVDAMKGGHSQPKWYQWFYVVHFFSFFAASVLATFEIEFKTSVLFWIVLVFACLFLDCAFMGLLWKIVSDGEIAIQFFFIGVDVVYIIFYALLYHRVNPLAYVYLLFMNNLYKRLLIANQS